MLTPQISATIQQLFQGAQRTRAFGYFASVAAVSTAIGPLAGGALIAAFGASNGWRTVFFVNVPIGLALIPGATKYLPRQARHQGPRAGLDPAGVCLLGVGIVFLLLPLIQDSWGHWRWWLLAAAAAVLALFIWHERRVTDPVLDLHLFRERSYNVGGAVITLYFAAFTPVFFILTLLVQLGLRYSAVEAGAVITPFAAGAAVSASVAGRLAAQHARGWIAIGLLLVIAGMLGSALAVALVPRHGTGWATLVPLLVAGVGGGIIVAPNQSLSLSHVPLADAGAAAGLLQTGQRLGTSAGIAAVGAVFFATLRRHGSYAAAYRYGIFVTSAIAAVALILTLIDWYRLNRSKPSSVGAVGEAPARASTTST